MRKVHVYLETSAQAEPPEEAMKQKHAAVPGQVVAGESYSNVFEASTVAQHALCTG